MNFTRRGFLGLASGLVAEAVASRIIPPREVLPPPAPAGELVRVIAEPWEQPSR